MDIPAETLASARKLMEAAALRFVAKYGREQADKTGMVQGLLFWFDTFYQEGWDDRGEVKPQGASLDRKETG